VSASAVIEVITGTDAGWGPATLKLVKLLRMALPVLGLLAMATSGWMVRAQGPRGESRTWDARLRAEAPMVAERAGRVYRSSSRVDVAFSRLAGAHHYVVVARERSARTALPAVSVAASEDHVTLRGLNPGATYAIDITACADAACSSTVTSTLNDRVTATTEEETWQIQASGDSIASATRIVADGNVKIHATRFGPEAPPEVRGRVQIYYGPITQSTKGLAVGVSETPATTDPLTSLRFTSLAGQSGLMTPSSAATLVSEVATGQALPLTSGIVRLYFEARGADGRTRIMHIDSKDGWVGRDFNAGPSTVCSTSADYAAGGPCAPVLDVAVSTDPFGNPGFTDARQFKIGYPLLDDWRFDEKPGTFMILTVSGATACTRAARTSAYALWDGARWVVQYNPNGCPKLFENIQAPMPVHIGRGRYKMYYGNPTEMTGVVSGSQLPWLGPKRVAYADAASTGDPNVVEFEDWEPLAVGRNVHFVWPSGRALTDTEAGYLDDFVMLTPTGDATQQVMYTAMTDGRIAPFATMAILLNP
jgi:hypothetical protein